jgi:hypothetical protein
LFLAAAQVMERTLRQVGGAGGRQRVLRDANVVWPFNGEETKVGVTAHQDNFDDAVFEGELGFLRHHCNLLRNLAARQLIDGALAEPHPAG